MPGELTNHLWQSTAFASVAGLLTLALRHNRARVRHWLWFAASVKFLIPLSMLIALGGQIEWKAAPVQRRVAVAMEQVVEPFTVSTASTPIPVEDSMPDILFALWVMGVLVISSTWLVRWRRIQNAVRKGSTIELNLPLRVVCSPTTLEPGVFGMFRPVLLLPNGIFDRLPPAQLNAILTHELCHVRHHDNLLAAIHMFVETVFWFHPLVWFIGKRMVAEREQACDEEVLRELGEPQAYAEGILNVCKLYVESPLRCVSGVTGADLKKRIEAIMTNRRLFPLSLHRRIILGTAALATLALPLAIGMMQPSRILAQSPAGGGGELKFEVASIRLCEGGGEGKGGVNQIPSTWSPGRMNLNCQPIEGYIRAAYTVYADGQTRRPPLIPAEGGPNWIRSERYSIAATAANNASPEIMNGPMLQSLLEERLKLKLHRETREIPVYELTVARGGPKLQPFKEGTCVVRPPRDLTKLQFGPPTPEPGQKWCASLGTFVGSDMVVNADGMALSEFALRFLHPDGRPVIDKTGLAGKYNFHLEYAPDESLRQAFPDLGEPTAPSIFTAVQEQLGLKLEPAKGPGEFLVIDSAERPSEN